MSTSRTEIYHNYDKIVRELLPLPGEEDHCFLDATGLVIVHGSNEFTILGHVRTALLRALILEPKNIFNEYQLAEIGWSRKPVQIGNEYENVKAQICELRSTLDDVKTNMSRRIRTKHGKGYYWDPTNR